MSEPSPPLSALESALRGKTVLVTGNTGFTGSWICLWLLTIGARPKGFSLPPPTNPSLFAAARLDADIETVEGDVRDHEAVRKAVRDARPQLILHLAAQPLVRCSYRNPLETFSVNAMGTANVLEAARLERDGLEGILCVTTDKVYKNREQPRPYRETDELGGQDPYSASKVAAEAIIAGYRASFFQSPDRPALAVARGGNIIGGGDWAEDRLAPDFVRAVVSGTLLSLRSPKATRPWQHVLSLCQGYLTILAGLSSGDSATFAREWNLGPDTSRPYSVREMLELLAEGWRSPEMRFADAGMGTMRESMTLAVDSSLARQVLGWRPVWDTRQSALATADWYKRYYACPDEARALTLEQIRRWRMDMTHAG